MLTSLTYFQTLISILSRRIARSEEGASMVEYALLLALVAVVCLGAVTLIGTSATDKFTSIANEISK